MGFVPERATAFVLASSSSSYPLDGAWQRLPEQRMEREQWHSACSTLWRKKWHTSLASCIYIGHKGEGGALSFQKLCHTMVYLEIFVPKTGAWILSLLETRFSVWFKKFYFVGLHNCRLSFDLLNACSILWRKKWHTSLASSIYIGHKGEGGALSF